MNSISETNLETGQGAMPPVPAFNVPCEKCQSEVSLVDGQIPVTCPHCGYHLRPQTDSIWSHFLFVLRRRYIAWRGRATRKEFWSFVLISHIIWLLFLIGVCLIVDSKVPECSCPVGHLGAIITASCISFAVYIPFIGIPQIFLFARRLHDIGMSGITVIIHLVLTVLLIGAAIGLSIKSSEQYSNSADAAMVDDEGISDDLILDDDVNEELPSISTVRNESGLLILTFLVFILNLGVEGLKVFFLIISFLNSNRGTNKFGPSRKYPIGA